MTWRFFLYMQELNNNNLQAHPHGLNVNVQQRQLDAGLARLPVFQGQVDARLAAGPFPTHHRWKLQQQKICTS